MAEKCLTSPNRGSKMENAVAEKVIKGNRIDSAVTKGLLEKGLDKVPGLVIG
ncbi:MAG: hypothetical protein WBK70_04460 [Thermacetogeniaceae bacterium]|jgi:hypothetical protein